MYSKKNCLAVSLLWTGAALIWSAVLLLRFTHIEFFMGLKGVLVAFLAAGATGFSLFCAIVWWLRFFRGEEYEYVYEDEEEEK